MIAGSMPDEGRRASSGRGTELEGEAAGEAASRGRSPCSVRVTAQGRHHEAPATRGDTAGWEDQAGQRL